jgi:hypothetical protein
VDDQDRPDQPDDKPSGELGGQPVEPDELVPEELMPDPPEGGNRQPREDDAVEREPGQDL